MSSEALYSVGGEESPLNPAGVWRSLTASSSWVPRDGAGLLELDGDLYLLGGWNVLEWASPSTVSEVWKSTDGGRTWTQLADAPWDSRHSAGWVVGDGKIWVVGGDANSTFYQRDVWYAEPDGLGGLNWTQATADAAPLTDGRVLHQVFWHDDKLWIVGGQTLDEAATSDTSTKVGSVYYDDVWSSPDGVTWTLVSSGNAWSPTASIIGAPVRDGFMWLIGGGAYDTEGNPRVYKNDVWKSADGVTWTEVPQTVAFPERMYNAVEVVNDHFVVVAGYDGANMVDTWISKDGAIWRQVTDIPWVARHAMSTVVHDGEVLMLGGPLDETTVWSMR